MLSRFRGFRINNRVGNGATRHFATKFYALQQWKMEGLISLSYVESKQNLADQMTKITRIDFLKFRNSVLIKRGSVRRNKESNVKDINLIVNEGREEEEKLGIKNSEKDIKEKAANF